MAISVTKAEFAPLLFAGQPDKALQTAVELGYDAVEVSVLDPSSTRVRQFESAVRSSGIKISAIATGQSYYVDGLSPIDTSASVRATLERRMKLIIEAASMLDCYVIIGGVRGRLSVSKRGRDAELKRARSELRKYALFAQEASVTLLLEPINRYETNFINTLAQAQSFVASIGCENFGLLLDTFHMNIEEVSLTDALISAASNLRYVHTADSNRQAPGLGHVDFRSLVKVLSQIHYEGYLCAEVLPLPDSVAAATQAIGFLKSLASEFDKSKRRGGER